MKKIIILSLFIVQFGQLMAQNYSGPESVEFDYARNRYLISNTSSHQIIASQNGVKTVFATLSGTGPHGLEIVGDTLYCCNGGSIKAFNLTNGAVVFTKGLGASFLNGITQDPNGNLYITDFSAKKIYRMNTLNRNFNVYVNSTVSTPNGIIYDNYDGITPRLIFCNWSSNAPIKKINLSDSTVSTLASTTLSNCDGICKGKNGKFYISNWGTQSIHRFDSTFIGGSTAVVSGLSNPADIVYNLLTDTLGVPNASNNTVSFHYLGNSTFIKENKSASNFTIYPNPSQGKITVESPVSNINLIRIFNPLMQKISEQKVPSEKQIDIKIPLIGFAYYYVQINNETLQKVVLIQ